MTGKDLLRFVALGAGGLLAYRAVARRKRRLDLAGRVALVTGGSRGLGLAIARQLLAEGCKVAIAARDPDELQRAAARLESELGGKVLTIPCDLTHREEAERAVAVTIDQLGGLDLLVNNAGIIEIGPFERMEIGDFRQAMDIHLWAPLYTTLAAVPAMTRAGAGRIVNISSIGGKVAVPHMAPYTASKFALVGLSNELRAELRKRGIYVTTVCPGLMRTQSHVNVDVRGDVDAEYAWFATAGSLRGLSMSPERAAKKIVRAGQYGDPQLIVGMQARLLVIADALLPGLMADALALVNRMLPEATGEPVQPTRGREIYQRAPEALRRRAERSLDRYNQPH